MSRHCVCQRWHSHPSRRCHCWPNVSIFTSSILHNSRICHLWCSSSQEMSYCNWHPINQFLPLAIEIFGYLHKHVNVFLHDCANAIWSLKGLKGLHLSTLVTFFHQKVSITLQKMQMSSILSQAIAIGLVTSWFPPLQNTPPITVTDLLQVVNFWHIYMVDIPQVMNYGHGEIFTPTLSQLDILSFLPFPLVYSFVHFPNLLCVFQ